MASGAGLVVRVRGERAFLPALLVEAVVSQPLLSPIPGSPLQLALVAGRVVPVVELGAAAGEIVVCRLDGEAVALAGAEVEQSGFFAAAGDGIAIDGIAIPPLDLRAELERALGSQAGAGA